jgi:alpha-tubulin suppressor-like RCC1 family protein
VFGKTSGSETKNPSITMKAKQNLIQLGLLMAMAALLALAGSAQTVTQIAEGQFHSLLLKSDGTMWVMGANSSGELGDGTINQTNQSEFITNNVAAIAAKVYFSIFLKRDGSVWGMGYNGNGQLGDGSYNNTNRPEMVVPGNVTAIAAGYAFTLLLKNDGSLWGSGDEGTGELGDGNTNASAKTNQFELIVSNNVTEDLVQFRKTPGA